MITVEEIKKIWGRYKELYQGVRTEQEKDQRFHNDTFEVTGIKKPHKVVRIGTGTRIVDVPAEQMVTSNPQAFFYVLKGRQDATERLSQEVNLNWIELLRQQNPNTFKESVKNLLGRGENYIKLCHNETWVSGSKIRSGLPVLFLIPDPMVIYGSPREDDCGWIPNCGVPNNVIVFYERQPLEVIVNYPSWSNPKKAGEEGSNKNKKVEWFEYWDKDVRYFEADGEPVLKGGINTNIYGFVPFVRKYSGFGRRSPEGKLEDLIMSDIRPSRGLIEEECCLMSDISSIFHLFAHKTKTIITDADIDEGKLKDSLAFGAYDLNYIQIPAEAKRFDIQDINIEQPSAELFAHLRDVQTRIVQRHPFLMVGYPLGTSGRQQDITSMAAMRRYDTVIEGLELAFATAIEMALGICQIVPTLKPDGIRKSDLDTVYKCEIRLKAKDPVEEDRLVTLGERLWNFGDGSIDLETLHTQFQGRTQEESKRIRAKLFAEKLIYGSDAAQVLSMVFQEESGLEAFLEQLKQGEGQGGLGGKPTPTQQRRLQGEIQTETGREQAPEGVRGGRTPPAGYLRG